MKIKLADYRKYKGTAWYVAFTVWPSLIIVNKEIWLDWLFWSPRISFKRKLK